MDETDVPPRPVTQSDLEEVERRFTEALEASANTMVGLLQAQDKQISALEDQMAVIVLGFADQTVALEAIVGHLKFDTPEAKASFDAALDENRRKMLKVMQDAVETMDGPDRRTADALSNIVRKEQNTSE